MKRHKARRPGRWRGLLTPYLTNNRGVALVITLFVVALITVLVLEYHFDASVEIDLAANYASDVQAYHLAMAGVHFARALLLQDDDPENDGPDDLWYRPNLIPEGICLPPQLLVSQASDAEVSPFEPEDAGEPESTRSDQGGVCLRIVDEQRKLPINALLPDTDNAEPDQDWYHIFQSFFESETMQIAPDKLEALIDWIDPDDSPRPGGAEDSYYEGLDHPYKTPRGPMRTPGELRLVLGFTDYETLAKLFPGFPLEFMADVDLGTNNYFTPYGTKEDGKVNLNTADGEVLCALIDGLDGNCNCVEEEIINRRESQEVKQLEKGDMSEIAANCDISIVTRLEQVAALKSTYFRVESTGEVEVGNNLTIKKKVIAVLKRSGQQVTPVYFKVE